jgi:hypothetical protein
MVRESVVLHQQYIRVLHKIVHSIAVEVGDSYCFGPHFFATVEPKFSASEFLIYFFPGVLVLALLPRSLLLLILMQSFHQHFEHCSCLSDHFFIHYRKNLRGFCGCQLFYLLVFQKGACKESK